MKTKQKILALYPEDERRCQDSAQYLISHGYIAPDTTFDEVYKRLYDARLAELNEETEHPQ